LLKSIKEFFRSLNPEIIVQAPSRINLINPLDAVEGDFWMPSVAINGFENPLSVFLYIRKTNDISKIIFYEIYDKVNIKLISEEVLSKDINEIKTKFKGEFKLIYASIYRFKKTNSYFWEKYLNSKLEIGIITTIPRQSGLGGSSAIIIAFLYGLAEYFKLINNIDCLKEGDYPINKDIIAEMTTKIEDKDLNITAGYADRYLICRGGLSFCSYCGKLYHKGISKEPLAVYDRIDEIYDINDLPIIICYSGVHHKSGSVHKKLRELYLSGEPSIIENYQKLAELAWKSRFALMSRNWKLLGVYFKENTEIMNRIMKNAGFKYGIGLANNILIKLIEDHPDVYAAKLTGAGGGGSVFALVNPKKIINILLNWQKKLNILIKNDDVFNKKFPNYPLEIKSKLKNAEFYRIKINQNGVTILK
jgi:glucuronokinase